jgi:hypothetical protein
MVMIQKQSDSRCSGRAHNDQEQKKKKKGVTGPKFDKEHAHYFFHVKGVAHRKFVPPNSTVNFDFYCDVLRHLRENVRRKNQNFGATTIGSITTTRSYMSLKTTEFVTKKNVVIVPHPPYSPYLAPCVFALFHNLKMILKGRRFETVSDIQRESQVVHDSIKENNFHGVLKRGKNDGIAVDVPNETVLKEMATKIE